MTSAGLPKGVYYEEYDGTGQWHQYSGGSNAQSSLIQFFDIILGVEHVPTKNSKLGSTTQGQGHSYLKVRLQFVHSRGEANR